MKTLGFKYLCKLQKYQNFMNYVNQRWELEAHKCLAAILDLLISIFLNYFCFHIFSTYVDISKSSPTKILWKIQIKTTKKGSWKISKIFQRRKRNIKRKYGRG